MYMMHHESFLLEIFNMLVVQEVLSSINFPIHFKFNKHVVVMYKNFA